MYEFVNKKEYQPIRNEIEEIIKIVQRYMRKNYDIHFQFRLIGSGGRHLITRVKNAFNSERDFRKIQQKIPNKIKNSLQMIT